MFNKYEETCRVHRRERRLIASLIGMSHLLSIANVAVEKEKTVGKEEKTARFFSLGGMSGLIAVSRYYSSSQECPLTSEFSPSSRGSRTSAAASMIYRCNR